MKFNKNTGDDENKNDILSFVDKYGVFNKDKYSNGEKTKSPVSSKRIVNKKGQPRETLDLHGLKSAEASQKLRFTVDRCSEHGIKELLVIHGIGYHSVQNGGPVLKEMVRQMLDNELCLHIRDYRTAIPKEGGDGATLVYLR